MCKKERYPGWCYQAEFFYRYHYSIDTVMEVGIELP